ncbi:MAG: alpha/beta fold hydrolase [Mariprofundales bacterium]|nr:alpha/beta fold hydrolase [Mariprofundales bacterium]
MLGGFEARAKLPRVFIHGWGQSPEIWPREQFAIDANDCLLSLPGHGGAGDVVADGWLDWLMAQFPKGEVALVGWSLGAMLALQLAARLPERIQSLQLFAATPAFCKRSDWPHGVELAQLEAMADSVRGKQKSEGLAHFTRLMLHGEGIMRAALRQSVAEHLAMIPLPTDSGLEAGLILLRRLDLRGELAAVHQPVHLVHGVQDAVVPIAAAQWLLAHLPNAHGEWRQQCGHLAWR